MAKLKDIKGSAIQYLEEDPVVNTGPAGAWASGGSLNTARFQMSGAGVSVTSGLAFGGFESPGTPYGTKNESYDGTSFTEVGDLNTGRRYIGGCGTQTAALASGNLNAPQGTFNEQWDGSSWTEVGDFNTNRYNFGQFGTTAAALAAGGETPGSPYQTANVETWNGSAWTEVGDLNNAKYGNRGFGSTTAGLVFGGATTAPSTLAETESWNGTSWTEVNDLNTARFRMGSTVSAGQSSGQAMGGLNPGYTQTESWDGTNWTEVADMSTGRGSGAGFGVSNSGVVAGGSTTASSPTLVANTEEFTLTPSTASTLNEGDMWFNYTTSVLKGYGTAASIPSTTWASGGSLNTARYRMSGAGGGATVSASMLAGGYKPSSAPPNDYFDNTETYDGTSFTEVNNLNSARAAAAGFGSSTSAIMAGGTSNTTNTEKWDGTNWTETGEINTGRSQFNGAGLTEPAGIVMGGNPGKSAKTESWNGSAWTEVSDLNTARDEFGSAGSQTSAAIFGGNPPATGSNTHEQWDGTSWTEAAEINTSVIGTSGSGADKGQMLKIGGYTSPGEQVNTEFWNGSSWTEINNLSTKRSYVHAAPGTAVSCILAGGYDGTTYGVTTNEEFEADAAVSTVTTS